MHRIESHLPGEVFSPRDPRLARLADFTNAPGHRPDREAFMQSVSSMRRVLAAVFFSMAATMPAVATVQTYGLDPTRYGTGGWGVCPPGSPYGTAIAVLGNSTYFQNFGDTLPAGSKITHIRINLPMSLGSFSSLHSDVTVAVDGVQIGNTTFVTNPPGNCNSGQVYYTFEQDFQDGLAAYKVGGSNFVSIMTSDLTQVAFGTLEVDLDSCL